VSDAPEQTADRAAEATDETIADATIGETEEARVRIERVGDIAVEPVPGGFSVSMRLTSASPDPEWLRLFDHPRGLALRVAVRRATILDASIEIMVQNEEQMSASVRYAEDALAFANQTYNDEVLPLRARHRRMREQANARARVDLEAMTRAASTL
jgi:hypothetical protein